MSTFDTFYGQNPWSGLTMNKRTWYVPTLLSEYIRESRWRAFVPTQVELTDAEVMKFTLFDQYEPNIDPIGFYDLYVQAMQTDSRQKEIRTQRYGGKVQFYEQDNLYNYWKEGPSAKLQNMIARRLAPAVRMQLDTQARNAFLQGYYNSYAMDVAKTSFNNLAATDLFDLDWLDNIQLMLGNRQFRGFDGSPGSLACVISPGTYYQIKQHDKWQDWNLGTESGRATLLNGVVGRMNGVTFVLADNAVLWNAGPITQQTTITAPVRSGDGAAAAVNGWEVGQTGAVNYITVADPTGFAKNDIVTIHKTRTSAYGVANGVNPYAGMKFERVVYSVDAQNKRISFTRPLHWSFDQDLGGSVYGYVTQGLNVHTSTFIAAPGAVVLGVTRPVLFHEPRPVDDFDSVYRLSWDGFYDFVNFDSQLAFPVFHAGYHSFDGSLQTGA